MLPGLASEHQDAIRLAMVGAHFRAPPIRRAAAFRIDPETRAAMAIGAMDPGRRYSHEEMSLLLGYAEQCLSYRNCVYAMRDCGQIESAAALSATGRPMVVFHLPEVSP